MEKKYAGDSFPNKKHNQEPDNSGKFKDDLVNCSSALKSGGIVLFPSETGWGIGADATNDDAVKKLLSFNPAKDPNNMVVLVEHADRLGRHVKQIPEMAIQLIEVNDKPMTIIYPGAVNLAENVIGSDGSAAMRITSDSFCKKLIATINKPVVFSPLTARFKDIPENIKTGADFVVKWRQNDASPGTDASIMKVGLRGQIDILKH